MNLLPLAALLIACLALAVAVSAFITANRPVRRRQVQNGGSHSIQVQTGGNLSIDESDLGRRERIARETAERMAKMGRHL
jgi:hypothetical protein